MEPDEKTINVKVDTWRELWRLKLDLGFRSHDQVIQLALGVLKIVKVVADEYKLDILTTASDMAKYYDEYLRRRLRNEKRRGL